jgi:hypothetical protein
MKILSAKEGYVFALKDRSAVYGSLIYMSDIDSEDRYIEVTKEEGENLKKEIEAKYAVPNFPVKD